MLSHADLPGCTSTTHTDPPPPDSNARPFRIRFTLSRRALVKTLLGLSIPTVLLSTALPASRPGASAGHPVVVAPAAAFALAGTTSAFMGDGGLSDAEVAQVEADEGIEGTLDFGAPAAKPTVAQVAVAVANFRTGPGRGYRRIARLQRGTTVTLLDQSAGWSRVQTSRGRVGWIFQDLLTFNANAPAAVSASSASATVGGNRTNLRQGPGTSFASLGKLGAGAQLALVARHGDWVQVRTARGTVGWIRGDLINVSSAALRGVPVTNDVPAAPKQAVAEQAIAGSGRGAAAARVALRFVGSRYRWGGASPRGFDCSGLVLYAYRQVGLNLPHKARSQFSTRYGTRIRSISALRPGDIVAFANTAGRGITHVAIYVGNGRMVTANSPRTGVQLANINTRYWRSHFAGAIRP